VTEWQEWSVPYASDAPVVDQEQDSFNRWPFAERIARTIAGYRDPASFVVSVNGAWGEGKSSVLNFIEEELGRYDDRVVCVRFDPWQFGDEAQLVQIFFATLAAVLDQSLTTTKQEIGQFISEYAAPIIPPIGVGPVQVKMADALKNLADSLTSSSLAQRRKRIEDILEKENKRVVVLMDDIDRLDRKEIQAVFKLVKLSANFAHTAYVLAFDQDKVAAALSEVYGPVQPEAGREAEAGHDFLEKIVQLPLPLPSVPRQLLRQFCFDVILQMLRDDGVTLTEEHVHLFTVHFTRGLEIRLRTPRDARRFGNALAFALPMLTGEVNAIDLMLIEGMRIFYPTLYATVRGNPDVFLDDAHQNSRTEEQAQQRHRQIIQDALEGLTPDEVEAARRLLTQLFPPVGRLFGYQTYDRSFEARWASEQRATSRRYFSRYFAYTVLQGDISDRDIVDFVAILETEPVAIIADNVKMLRLVRDHARNKRLLTEQKDRQLFVDVGAPSA